MDSTPSVPVPRATATTADLKADLARAWKVWRQHPGLPLGTAVVGTLGAASANQGPIGILAGIVGFVLIGWVGTERLWYLRASQGRGLTARELLPVTLGYFPRFFCLAMLAGGVFFALCLPPIVAVVMRSIDAAGTDSTITAAEAVDLYPLWALVWVTVVVLVLDMIGTFVTPALVYSTWRVTEALRLGFGLLRRSWPHAALYVVVPPLALVLVNQAAQPTWTLGFFAVIVAAMLNLLVKGAVAAYYLRAMSAVGPDGAHKPTRGPQYSADWTDHR